MKLILRRLSIAYFAGLLQVLKRKSKLYILYNRIAVLSVNFQDEREERQQESYNEFNDW